jgi:hypothetical protein
MNLANRVFLFWSRLGWRSRLALSLAGVYALIVLALMVWWGNHFPARFDPVAEARARAEAREQRLVPGYVTTHALIQVGSTLLDKRGGYLSNDRFPPGVLLDNVPNWEFGVVQQMRDLARALRNDLARSQTQSAEDVDLREAEPLFNFNSDSWLFPPTEREYRKALRHLESYLDRLADPRSSDAEFYARADNLANYFGLVSARLGSLSQRLSASVGRVRVNTDIGDPGEGARATHAPELVLVQTPWYEVDDVFYEARGTCWALIHFLKAIEHDFAPTLERKNALVSLRQIIRELEATQETVWSPVILNGSGFGMTANHSLVMANYISRANAALIDLRALLRQG